MDETRSTRRRVLQGAGAIGALLLAGCSESDSDDDGNETGNNTTGTNTSDTGNSTDGNSTGENTGEQSTDDEESGETQQREVAISPAVDQQEIRQLQIQLQSGQISQAEFQQRRRDLLQGAIDSLVGRVETETTVTVVEEFPGVGAVRARGSPGELLDTLEFSEAQALISAETLDSATAPDDGSENSSETNSSG
jgi:hypothetical protein